MCPHISIYSFIHTPSIYDACTQILRGQNPNHIAAVNESGLTELSAELRSYDSHTLCLALHASSHQVMLVRLEQAVLLVTPRGHGSLHTPSLSGSFTAFKNGLDAVQDGYKSHTSPSQHGEGIGSANQTTRPPSLSGFGQLLEASSGHLTTDSKGEPLSHCAAVNFNREKGNVVWLLSGQNHS